MKLLAALLLLSSAAFASAQVHVRSTVTRRGTYRQPHYRTAPNRTQRDNYSSRGNTNPYTGKHGSRTPKY